MTSPTINVSPRPATEQGALDGHAASCSACGFVGSTSLGEREARSLGAKHLAWHASRDRGGRRR